jgi:hypothetical protein
LKKLGKRIGIRLIVLSGTICENTDISMHIINCKAHVSIPLKKNITFFLSKKKKFPLAEII